MTFARILLAGSVLAGFSTVTPMSAAAQTAMLGGPQRISAPAQSCARQTYSIPRGKSMSIDFPSDIREAQVTDPATANIRLHTPRRFSIQGLAPGQTDAAFYDALGRCALVVDIRVEQDVSGLMDTIQAIMPGSNVRAQAVNDGIILTGLVPSNADSDRVLRIANRYVSKPELVLNMLAVADRDQVMLSVRVVEVNRSIIKQLGFDTKAIFGQLGMDQFSIGNSPSYAINGGFQGGGGLGYSLNTTSQPVSTGIGGLFSNLVAVPFAPGITASNVGQFVQTFLQGGAGLTAAQSVFTRDYLAQYASKVFVTDVNGVTYTAADVGVSINNLPALTQAYLNNTSTLSPLGNEYIRKFVATLPTYNTAYSETIAPSSTFIDRTNPANAVATGRAGATGLNQANALMQAFERDGLVRTLAEPNLTTVSGESAKFLAGGEYPVPSGRDSQGNTVIQFKPYGVGLGFTPVVLSGGRISLKVSVEVSELSNQGALTLAGVGGVGTSAVIPALSVRRAENTVELSSGGSMQIAGLLQESTRQNLDKVPGIADVPILGALARSRDYLKNETELVIIVTAYLVDQASPDTFQTPADGLRIASDAETNLLGRLNHAYKAPEAPAAVAARTYEGPIGHVID